MPETPANPKLHQQIDHWFSLAAFVGGIAIIVGTLFPWVTSDTSTFFSVDSPFSTAARDSTGVGFWGLGAGTIVFILGWLTLGGVFNFTFSIPRNTYLAAMGVAAYSLVLGYIFFANDLDFGIGVWISLGGASLLVGVVSNVIFRPSMFLASKARFDHRQLPFINVILAVGVGLGVFNLPFATETGDSSPNIIGGDVSKPDRLFDINIHFAALILSLLVVLLLITVTGQFREKSPPAALFFVFSVPLLALSSIFIFSSFFGQSEAIVVSGAGAGNWVIFTSALIVTLLSLREIRKESKAQEAMAA